MTCSTGIRHSSFLTWFILASIAHITGILSIPLTLKDPPTGFRRIDGITVYVHEVGVGFDSDTFCQMLYSPWWIGYQAIRYKRFVHERGPLGDPGYSIPFTQYLVLYPDQDPSVSPLRPYAPVEGAYGETFLPSARGWRNGHHGCNTGCQDLQKTREWILGIKIEDRRQVRVSSGLGFLCQEGLVAVTETKKTLREVEPESDIQSALASLQTKMPTIIDKTTLEGDTDEVTKCKCVVPTAAAQLRNKKRKGIQGSVKGRPKSFHSRRSRQDRVSRSIPVDRPPRPRITNTGLSGTQVKRGRGRPPKSSYIQKPVCEMPMQSSDNFEQPRNEQITQSEQGESSRICDDSEIAEMDDLEDFVELDELDEGPLAGDGASMCYDFQYPDLPPIDLPSTRFTDLIDAESRARHNEQAVQEFVQAMLSAYSQFSSSYISGPGGPSNSKSSKDGPSHH